MYQKFQEVEKDFLKDKEDKLIALIKSSSIWVLRLPFCEKGIFSI